jgi:TRAP transporter 4TM/12TM fusion protein
MASDRDAAATRADADGDEALRKAEAFDAEGAERVLPAWLSKALFALCAGYALFHFAVLNYVAIDEWVFRVLHVNIAAVAVLLLYRASGWERGRFPLIPDWLLAAAALGCTGYIMVEYDQLIMRSGVITTTADFVVGAVGTAIVVEMARRTSGLVLPIVALAFVAYVFAGPALPGVFRHSGFPTGDFFSFIYSQEGVFGITTAASSRYIILFVAFAVFLQACGAGAYFMQVSMALFGWLKGGPGKVAVVSSVLFGSVSGSAVANVVASGSFTIPLMKRTGYPAKSAAAIEATASSGGQLTPPVMGAGAFIMAEITGIPYAEIVVAAILPCALFYIAVFTHVHLQAEKLGIRGLPRSELPPIRSLGRDALTLLPLAVLLGLLGSGYSIIAAGTWGVASTLLVILCRSYALESRVLALPLALYLALPAAGIPVNAAGLAATLAGAAFVMALGHRKGGAAATRSALADLARTTADGLSDSTKRSLQLIAVMACAGVVVGVLGLTGLGGRLSSAILAVAGESQALALVLSMAISIVLGMGMPTTAAYAIAAAVIAPALQQLGIPVLAAHMFVFYCAVISAITPPVAIAAFAAAAIAQSRPFATSVLAVRFGVGAFVVPFLFYTNPEILMRGDPLDVVRVFATAACGVAALACAGEGRLFGPVGPAERVAIAVGAVLLIVGTVSTDVAGAALLAALAAWRFARSRRAAAA